MIDPTPAVRGVLARRPSVAPLAVGAGLAAWTAALAVRDPHRAGSWGHCAFLDLTGMPCPACGGLRAVNDLTHGDLVGALSSNLLVTVAIPVVVLFWFRWYLVTSGRRPDMGVGLLRPRTVWFWFAVLVAFGVLRNLPFGAWLAP